MLNSFLGLRIWIQSKTLCLYLRRRTYLTCVQVPGGSGQPSSTQQGEFFSKMFGKKDNQQQQQVLYLVVGRLLPGRL